MFKPGQSGNPSGKPKEAYQLTRLARLKTPRAFEIVVDILENSTDRRLRLEAAKVIFDRAEGKPAQQMELSGPDGKGLFESLVSAPPKLSREEWILTYNQALKKELTQ